MASSYTPIRLAKEQPILRRSGRRKSVRAADPKRLERDFWSHFNLEKFASDWRRGIGRRPIG